MKLDSGCEPSVIAIQCRCLLFPLMYRQIQSDFKQCLELGRTGFLILRAKGACIMLPQGLRKEPALLQKNKLNELTISQLPLMTLLRASYQHS